MFLIYVELGEATGGRLVAPAAAVGPQRDEVPLRPVSGEAAEVPLGSQQNPEVGWHRGEAVFPPHRPLPALNYDSTKSKVDRNTKYSSSRLADSLKSFLRRFPRRHNFLFHRAVYQAAVLKASWQAAQPRPEIPNCGSLANSSLGPAKETKQSPRTNVKTQDSRESINDQDKRTLKGTDPERSARISNM